MFYNVLANSRKSFLDSKNKKKILVQKVMKGPRKFCSRRIQEVFNKLQKIYESFSSESLKKIKISCQRRSNKTLVFINTT
jgi:hypothetical protein